MPQEEEEALAAQQKNVTQ
eukprot:gene26619-biopygen17007